MCTLVEFARNDPGKTRCLGVVGDESGAEFESAMVWFVWIMFVNVGSCHFLRPHALRNRPATSNRLR